MDKYGKHPVVKIINNMERLRRAIRAEGTQKVQEAWDEVEPTIDFFLRRQDGDKERNG